MFASCVRFFSSSPQIHFVPALLKTKPIATKLQLIYTHTFNEQLFNGTLSAQAFGQYLHDDYIYLHHFALGLTKLSTQASPFNPKLANQLHYLSTNIISGEHAMQKRYSDYFTHTPESKPGKAVTGYIDFFNTHIEISEVPIALCSILACFLIYCDLGAQKLLEGQLVNNPYKQWIIAYSKREFVEATALLIEIVNNFALHATDALQIQMKETIHQAIEFELEFFNEVHPARHLKISCIT